MKTYEILTLYKELFIKLSSFGIRSEDCKYLALYDEYLALIAQGEKVTYIVATLSVKYQVSERQIYAVIKRFGQDCNPVAATLRS